MDVHQDNLWNFYDISDLSFCLSGIVLQFGDNIYSRTSSINGGIILSTKCPSSWILHEKHLPYLQCFDNLFEFSALSNNGDQYQVDIHLCGQSSSGISAESVRDIKMSLTGKSHLEGIWRSIDPLALDYGSGINDLSLIRTAVDSQNVFLSGDLLYGSELTKYIIRGATYRSNSDSPGNYKFSPPKNGHILGYHLSYLSSVRYDDNEINDLLYPIMYKLSYELADSFIVIDDDDLETIVWVDSITSFGVQEAYERPALVFDHYNYTTNTTYYRNGTEYVVENSFLAPNDEFMTIHDYKKHVKYITNDDSEMYVIFDKPKEVVMSDNFMISMVLPSLSTTWADQLDLSANKQHWDEYVIAAENYDFAKTGPIASISFIYDSDIKNKNLYSIQENKKTGEQYNWESAASNCVSNDDFSNLASITNSKQMVWAHLEVASKADEIVVDPEDEPISIRYTNQYEWVYDSTNSNSGNKAKIFIYKPVIKPGEYFVTMVAVHDKDDVETRPPKFTTPVFIGGPSDAFIEPEKYEINWSTNQNDCNPNNDPDNDCKVGNYWALLAQPIPPNDDYACLGDVAWLDKSGNNFDQSPPRYDTLFGYRCIKKTYLTRVKSIPEVTDDNINKYTDYVGDIYWSSGSDNTNNQMNVDKCGKVFFTIPSTVNRYYEFTGWHHNDNSRPKGTFRNEWWDINQDYVKSTNYRDDSNYPWIGLRHSINTNKWLWVDQSELTSDIITMDDIVANSGSCGTLSNSLESTTTKTTFYADYCDNSRDYYMCEADNGDWEPNQIKSFLVNVGADIFDEVILISFENTGNNAICIDQVNVNEEASTFISSYWIATTDNNDEECITHSCEEISFAIIRYPVCAIDIIDTRYNFKDDSQWTETMNVTAAVSECKNYNRLQPSGCEVSQSITVADETGYEISDGFSSTESQSSGNSNAVEKTDSKTDSWSVSGKTELTWKKKVPVRRRFIAGPDEIMIGAEAGGGGETTYSTSKTEEEWKESGYESSTESSTTNSWSETTEHDVTCVASIEVPPSHKQTFSLLMNRYRGIVPIEIDMKLTLCSSYLDPSNPDNTEHYRYIYNVPSSEYLESISKCEVQFDSPSILLNHLTCDQEQELSFLLGAEYMPTCNTTQPSKYDGCQCQIIDTLTSAVCACVDMEGNVLNSNSALVVETDDWRDTCGILNCDHSIYKSSQPTTSPTSCIEKVNRFLGKLDESHSQSAESFTVFGNCFHENYFTYYKNGNYPEDNNPDDFTLKLSLTDMESLTSEYRFKKIQNEDIIYYNTHQNKYLLLDNNKFPSISYSLQFTTSDISKQEITTEMNINWYVFHMNYDAFLGDYECCDEFNQNMNGITMDILINNWPFNADDIHNEYLTIHIEFDIYTDWKFPATDNEINGDNFDDHYNDLMYLYLPTYCYIDGYDQSNKHKLISIDISDRKSNDGITYIDITFPVFNKFLHFGKLNTAEIDNDDSIININHNGILSDLVVVKNTHPTIINDYFNLMQIIFSIISVFCVLMTCCGCYLYHKKIYGGYKVVKMMTTDTDIIEQDELDDDDDDNIKDKP